MQHINPMLYMDKDYMWRWFTIDAHGKLRGMSARAFFNHKECRRDYDSMRGGPPQP